MTKQIDIKELIPYLKKGWVAMDENGTWLWCEVKPKIKNCGIWELSEQCSYCTLTAYINIAPISNWTKSLIKVENKDEFI